MPSIITQITFVKSDNILALNSCWGYTVLWYFVITYIDGVAKYCGINLHGGDIIHGEL